MISGAEIMVKCLEAEGVEVVFGYPGATICPFYDKIYDSQIKHILVRQEQNAAHMASGYARCSNKPGVCVATSGPGATNLITGIATAYTDSIPLIAITGQVRSDLLGRDVFQEADITGACEPFVKHSYIVKKTEDLPRVFKEAFYIASTGRKGPVLIDIPMDIQINELESFEYPESVNIIGYKPNTKGHTIQVRRAVEAIKNSKRPVIVSGGGVLLSGVKPKFRKFAEKTSIPVISTMMGIGVMPSEHELYLGMLGTHGKTVANRALHDADLVIVCGARLGDRAVASPHQMSENTLVIHIDIDPAEIGKNVKTEIPIVGDMKNVMNMLIENIGDYVVPNQWQETVKTWKKDFLRVPPVFDGFVEPRTLIAHLSSMLRSKAILVADVGQNQIWCANNFRIRDGRFLTTGGMGTMGYSIPAAVGAKFARPNRDVVVVCGDGSFQMSMNELATIRGNDLGIKIIIMRNHRLGMVRELQDNYYDCRHSATVLQGDPDFLKIAEAYGIDHAEVSSNAEAEEILKNVVKSDKPFILVCNVYPDTPSI
ncbi:MAG: biosynthetic-type acetolactate synthase large subunit [Ruminococcus sp.]|jgi:acetolactate synthase-1/2/3 large subunit|nr:biosynthetic-type acetolactate synthase large subunit [Ruminococcus sp.]